MCAVLFAAAAFLVAVVTYRDQQQINRDQLVLNNLTRDRLERRFASRITWWHLSDRLMRVAVGGEMPVPIRVQNRSPASIRSVRLEIALEPHTVDAWYKHVVFELPDLPPCTTSSYDLVIDRSYVLGSPNLRELWRYKKAEALLFIDPVRSWQSTADGLQPQVDRRMPLGTVYGSVWERDSAKETADCGEGA